MILVDTPNWIDHLRVPDETMLFLLSGHRLLCHPFIVGEIAVGMFRRRDEILEGLQDLPQAAIATHDEVLKVVADHKLYGRGVGYIDMHLLTAVLLTADARLWTNDRRLGEIAGALGVSYPSVQ